MCPKDVNDYLEKGIYGGPQIKPEEKNKYLGTYRERIFFALTTTEMALPDSLNLIKHKLTENPNHQLLINGDIDFDLQCSFMAVAKKTHTEFKIVNPEGAAKKSEIGLVYCSTDAVNITNISLQGLTNEPQDEPAENKNLTKPSFFQKLWQKFIK